MLTLKKPISPYVGVPVLFVSWIFTIALFYYLFIYIVLCINLFRLLGVKIKI